MIATFQERLSKRGLALLPLRLMVGFGFAAHGYAKLSRGPEAFGTILRALGLPAPDITAWVTSLLEFFGGLLVMAGAFVVPLSVPLIATMLVAMLSVHLPFGFSSIKLKEISPSGPVFGMPGYELNLLYISGLLTLALGGSGAYSVDQWLRSKKAGLPRA